jgi:hypothetical protein
MTTYSLIRAAGFGLLWAAAPLALAEPPAATLSDRDQAAAFAAAGATRVQSMWTMCAENPNTTGARVESVSDVNGDGLPDAVIAEDGSFCYGFTGTGFALVSKQASGQWRLMTHSAGIPEFLSTRGADGWPDLQIGGPGFCFPVQRWDGKEYVLNRFEYEGKACTRPR